MNKAVVHISALCWLFLLRLKMHGTNIKLFSIITSIFNTRREEFYRVKRQHSVYITSNNFLIDLGPAINFNYEVC
jgi:hypothetical protein